MCTLVSLCKVVYNILGGDIVTEKKPLSEARKRANKKWNDANQAKRYDRIQLVVPKGRKADIDAHAKEQGESVNGLMNELLRETLGMTEEEWKRVGAAEEDS